MHVQVQALVTGGHGVPAGIPFVCEERPDYGNPSGAGGYPGCSLDQAESLLVHAESLVNGGQEDGVRETAGIDRGEGWGDGGLRVQCWFWHMTV